MVLNMLIVSGIIPTKIFEYVTLFLVKNTNPTNNKINNTSNKSSLLFFLIATSFNNMTNNINEYNDITNACSLDTRKELASNNNNNAIE